MPALKLFGRRWLLASDDVPAPAAFLAVFHTIWTCLLAAWIGEINGAENCEDVGPCNIAMSGLLGSFVLSSVLEFAATFVGLRGSIFETRKRTALPKIIYADAMCMTAQVGFNAYASYLVINRPPRCPDSTTPWQPVAVMHGLVWSTWAVIGGVCVLIISAYNLFPNYKDAKQWERQCECWAAACCGIRRQRRQQSQATKRLGALFALMFSHVDFTPSDVVVAFGLALNLQRLRRRASRLSATSPTFGGVEDAKEAAGETSRRRNGNGLSTPSPSSEDGLLESQMEIGQSTMHKWNGNGHRTVGHQEPRPDAAVLAEAAGYMKYAFAAYGWMLFVWQRRAVGCFQLCCGRACGLWTSLCWGAYHDRKSSSFPLFNHLQAPQINREAILQAAQLQQDSLISVRLESEGGINVLPYYIAVDHEKKAVIIAIRGSLSLEDVARDLLFEPADLDEWVAGAEEWASPLPTLHPAGHSTRYAAHSGIFEAARATLADIRAGGYLDALLRGPAAGVPDYSLVVCGHSLGAGCGFLISLYLRKFFPSLRCWAFSPPGGLTTVELCAKSTEWCTSVVCGREMIPRLTLATFERMRDELVHSAARCRKPKVSIILGWIARRRWDEADLFYKPESLPSEPRAWLDAYYASLAQAQSKRAYVETAGRFGPPGRVLYLKYTGKKERRPRRSWAEVSAACLGLSYASARVSTTREYEAVWVNGSELVEGGLLMSTRMMADHMPDYSLALLERLALAAGGGKAEVSMSDEAGDEEVRHRLYRTSTMGGAEAV